MTKSKGLKNPAAIVAAPIVAEQVGKAGKAAGKRADKINKDTKGGLNILLLLGIAAGVYTVWKLTAPLRAGAGAAAAGIDAITQNPWGSSDNPTQTGTPTITPTQAEFIAEELFDAMRGHGTNFTRIKNAMTGLTIADFTLVAQKFGTRRYAIVGGEPWPAPLRNLYEWLNRELDNKELQEVKSLIPGLGV